MRVPPFQSCTCASARRSATSGSRWRRQRVMLVSRVPKVKRVHLQVAPRQAVHEVQQQARVAVHRAGDVEQHHQRRQLAARGRRVQRRQRVRLARHALQRGAQVERGRARRGARGGARRTGCTGSGSCSASFLASSNSAVVMVSKSACCSRSRSEKVKRGVELQLFLGASGWPGSAARGACGAASASARRLARGGALLVAAAADLGQQQVHHLLQQFGSRQKASKAASNSALLLVRGRASRRASAACTSSRRSRPDHLAPPPARPARGRARRHAGAAQHAREVDDVLGQMHGRGAAGSSSARGAQLRPAACAVSPPCMRGDVVLVLEQHAQRVAARWPGRAASRPAPPARWSSRWSRPRRAA